MDDPREVELDCIAAIFPELILGTEAPFSAFLELPVHPTDPVKVIFPASADGAPLPTPPSSTSSNEEGQANAAEPNLESHNLHYLPGLQLCIVLPDGYPAECAPNFKLSTSPEWLTRAQLDELEAKAQAIWEENGRTEMVFDYIDSLQQAAENAFGCGVGKDFEVAQEYKIALLDYDIKATREAFDKETFDCGICLDPKKGSVCHKMIDCGHVFCVECLQDFYNNAIKEGDLISVRCLAPDCAKNRGESRHGKKSRKSKTQLSPSELLQIPLEHDVVRRYVDLKHKADLESDKNTVYCPRKWCQGAARSKKHRKPEGFEVVDSDDESDSEEVRVAGEVKKFEASRDLLSVCEDCGFAFCSRCFQGWHGEFTICHARKSEGELTEEEKASLEYVKLHTTPCPTCAAPAQKTHGCNHMICFKCNSHFCYLCSAWLEPSNPYTHFNDQKTGCYQRLWELEGGDGDDVGIGFFGARGPVVAADGIEGEEEEALPRQPALPDIPGRQVAVPIADPVEQLLGRGPEIIAPRQQMEREGPLVLRINDVPPRVIPVVPNAPQPAGRGPQNQNRRGRPGNGGRRRQQAGRGQVNDAEAARAQDEANQRWVQMFVQMAMNDEEDQLDSDDEDDEGHWEIPVRGLLGGGRGI